MRPNARAIAGAAGVALGIATADAEAGSPCVETSTVVGEMRCSKYGADWAIEKQAPVTARFGFRYGEVSPRGATFEETSRPRGLPRTYDGYRFSGDELGVSKLTAAGIDGGLTVFVAGQLYIGAEGGALVGAADTRTIGPRQSPRDRALVGPLTLTNATGADVLVVHGGVPVGYRIPLGRASIRGEAVFGGVSASVHQRVLRTNGELSERQATMLRGLIETRVAADIWFTQHVSFGAYAGANLLDPGVRAFGLALTVHFRAFDGDMSIF